MRAIDPATQALLDSGATTFCRCWLVRRSDSVTLGFTDHDGDIAFDGQVYRASTGLDAGALKTATGLSVDNASVVGALSDAGVTEDDIRAGRFDAAEVRQWLVNWREPAQRLLLFRGTFGEITRTDGGFEVELRGLAEALNTPLGRNLLKRCDAALGSSRCGVDLSDPAFSAIVTVEALVGDGFRLAGLGAFEAGWFLGGGLVWLDRANAGLTGRVRADRSDTTGRVFNLWEEPAFPVEPGDTARVTAGCDKLAATCRKKFDNFLNFRGFPHIPGEDWVTAYPKDGEHHDGGSRSR